MKLTNIVFCLTLLAGAATSCIREDLDDCLSTNTLLLSYKGDGTTEIFPDKICRVEMFVFDAENRCVNSSILPEEQVKDRTATLPPLAAGDYRIVCLGNTHHTKVDGIATGDFGRMLFAAGDYFDEKQVAGNDSLYYATTSYTVLPYSGDEEANQTKNHRVRQLSLTICRWKWPEFPPREPAQARCLCLRYAESRPVPILRIGPVGRQPTICLKPNTKPEKRCSRPVPT